VSSFSRPQLTLLTEYADFADPYAGSYDAYADSYEPYTEAVVPLRSADPDFSGGREAWKQDALCAETDPEAFFPEKGGSTREAKRVCVGCAVRVECLNYALENDERFGIWGGLSERERRRVRLQRREALSA
jgi:WhiB family redox-sensing transcriptional regulator